MKLFLLCISFSILCSCGGSDNASSAESNNDDGNNTELESNQQILSSTLTVSSQTTGTSTLLSWNNVAASHYRILIWDTDTTGTLSTFETTEQQISIPNAKLPIRFSYAVEAYDTFGNSVFSSTNRLDR